MVKGNEGISTPEQFVNPFAAGVSLDSFINALGKSSVKDYVSGQVKFESEGVPQEFNEHDIKWLEDEIKRRAYNIENKERLLAQSAADWKELNKNGQK